MSVIDQHTQMIQGWYQEYLGRPALQAEVNYWIRNATSLEQIQTSIQAESIKRENDPVYAYTTLLEDIKTKPEYPDFEYDTEAWRAAATGEYSPYYDELIKNLEERVDIEENRGKEDYQSYIDRANQLRNEWTVGNEFQYGLQQKSTQEDYANRGLYDSGFKRDEMSNLATANKQRVGAYESQFQYGMTQNEQDYQRLVEDLEREERLQKLGITRAKDAAIAQGTLNRQNEAKAEYNAGYQRYYSDIL